MGAPSVPVGPGTRQSLPNPWTSCVKSTTSSETYTSIRTRAISSPELERGHCSERRPYHANSLTANQVNALVSLKALTQLPDSQRFYFQDVEQSIYIYTYVSHFSQEGTYITPQRDHDPQASRPALPISLEKLRFSGGLPCRFSRCLRGAPSSDCCRRLPCL